MTSSIKYIFLIYAQMQLKPGMTILSGVIQILWKSIRSMQEKSKKSVACPGNCLLFLQFWVFTPYF